MAVPLGVMKAEKIKFNPQIPERYTEALGKMGSGVLDKLILRFREVFWQKDIDWFNFIAAKDKRYDWT